MDFFGFMNLKKNTPCFLLPWPNPSLNVIHIYIHYITRIVNIIELQIEKPKIKLLITVQ